MASRETDPATWGETLWLVTGAFVTMTLVMFIVTGALLGWFG